MKGLVLCSVMFVGLVAILGYASATGFGVTSSSFAPLTITHSPSMISGSSSRAETIVPTAAAPTKHDPHRKIEDSVQSDPTPNDEVAANTTPPTTFITAPEPVVTSQPRKRSESRRVALETTKRTSTPKKSAAKIIAPKIELQKVETPKQEVAKAEPTKVEVRQAPALVPPTHSGKDVTSG